ncbi:MAG: GTPase HflX [Clostridia bacterium]|nr:GTPase HflX [Clostridia bacterium]
MEKIISDNIENKTKAILCVVLTPDKDEREVAVSLAELERLLDTAGGELFAQVVQARQNPDNATYLGKGKIEEIGMLCKNNDVNLVICDDELSPAQIKNMEDALEEAAGEDFGSIRVIDRSMLILDIFALHAISGEGKLQVELAQLRYSVPRLYGKGTEMSRLGGGIGTRGPGETKLEKDRRHVRRRIQALEEQLAELVKSREVRRARRDNAGVFRVAIVGYTNAGKSTLLNRLTDAGILAEDKLFATLDTTTRKFALPSGREILLTDTVGFIRNLPHHLIEAFKSTLEEAKYNDALLIVIDASDPECVSQLDVTEKLLCDLGVIDKPIVYVLNKCDAAAVLPEELTARANRDKVIPISALDGRGVSTLVEELEALAANGRKLYCLKVPSYEMGVINKLYNASMVEDVEYFDGYARVIATMDDKMAGQLRRFIVRPSDFDKEEA